LKKKQVKTGISVHHTKTPYYCNNGGAFFMLGNKYKNKQLQYIFASANVKKNAIFELSSGEMFSLNEPYFNDI